MGGTPRKIKATPEVKRAEFEKHLRKLTDCEEMALAMIKPFDVRALQPVAILVNDAPKRMIWDYFRVVISSSQQSVAAAPMGRRSEWMLVDKTSGAFLGLWNYTDLDAPGPMVTEWAGARIGIGNNAHKTQNHIVQLKRCLPTFEFGDLTGGKLLALVATSSDVLAVAEMRYSFPLMALLIRTLHGKSSQYNRLHPRGIEYLGVDQNGKGTYLASLYANAKEVLREETRDPGARTTHGYADQVAYWKERWLPNRMDKTDGGWVRPDVERYRLSAQLRTRLTIAPEEHAA